MDHSKFDSYAATYNDAHHGSTCIAGEDPDYFAAYKVNYLANHLRKSGARSGDILDFGCGVGNCLTHLVPTFPESSIHGMDVSSASIAISAKNFPTVHTAVVSDALPLEDNAIDVAIAAGVFHHIPPGHRQQWMNELHRVIRPGGRFYLFEHNPINPVTRKIVRECPFDDDAILLHRGESLSRMKHAGFAGVSANYVMFFPHALNYLRPIERFLAKIPMGAQYVVCGIAQ